MQYLVKNVKFLLKNNKKKLVQVICTSPICVQMKRNKSQLEICRMSYKNGTLCQPPSSHGHHFNNCILPMTTQIKNCQISWVNVLQYLKTAMIIGRFRTSIHVLFNISTSLRNVCAIVQ